MNEHAISLIQQILEQEQKQTSLLETIASQNLALIEALADDTAIDPDELPRMHYLDGSPCR
ncbi:hypothetical protein ACTORR_24480 [Pseudomonas sp. SAR267]|uniref:hypothetical protein n=1 Tax=Pseudomonas sp. SAR267 TaxID=3454502 RepID=UPI003F933562